MRRIKDYPEYEEHRDFIITNDQRLFFGLKQIDEQWDEVKIKEGTTVFYDGDMIKKIITWENLKRYEYKERDTELKTRERQYVLPKTSRGKEKKITPTNLLRFMPSGCVLYISLEKNTFKSMVCAYSPTNNIRLPITNDDGIKTITQLKEWLNNYMHTCPADYFEKVEKMKTMPHRTIKYHIGDIFRFEMDREHYGFGLIIGKLRELEKLGVFCDDHPMLNVMTVPIFIRFYKIKTKDKDMPINEIIKNELLTTEMASDGDIIWGTHEIIGNKDLVESDIDFPLQYGYTINVTKKPILRLAWGIGMKKITAKNLPEELQTNKFLNHGIACSITIYQLNRVLNGESQFYEKDLRHPVNKEFRNKLFKALHLPKEIDMDTFNELNNGMTRIQYANFVNNRK